MATAAQSHMTPEEYLALERRARFRSEFVAGRMVAMTGTTRAHGLVVLALGSELRAARQDRRCEVQASHMRVKASSRGDYVYPDVVVACDPQFEDGVFDTLVNPVAIMEVLSDSTESYDRGEKFALYRRIETLREYVLLSQKEVLVEQYVREGDLWHCTTIDDLDGSLALVSLGVEIPLRRIYDDVLELLAPAEADAGG